jgi:hypothetical protein
MPPPLNTTTVGWLARALVIAENNLRDVEDQVEGFLTSLFPDGWQGWQFVRVTQGTVAIDVYEAIESPAAIAALHRAGFAKVRIHEHESSKFVSCVCPTHQVSS